MVTVGRDGNIVIEEKHLSRDEDNVKIMLNISRIHFEICRDRGRAVLMDLSSNGTFVNELKIGKNNRYQLNHGDVISLTDPNLSVYTFLLDTAMKTLYPEMVEAGYLVGRQVGEGVSAVVREAYTLTGNCKKAVKFIKKHPGDSIPSSEFSTCHDLMKEMDVLKGIKHPCITHILETIESPRNIIFVMEFAAGGELLDQVVKDCNEGKMKESHAKVQYFQIVHALAFLHTRRICHRDLKLENILLAQPGPTSRIIISDFGLSKKWSSVNPLKTFVGTPTYMAPEVISQLIEDCTLSLSPSSYSSQADCWSLGVILYMLLSGRQPFKHSSRSIDCLKAAILSAKYFPLTGNRWTRVSSQAKELVTRLLKVNPDQRLTAAEILEQEWFTADKEVVVVALRVMGLEGSLEFDSGDRKIDMERKRKHESEEIVRKRVRGHTEDVEGLSASTRG